MQDAVQAAALPPPVLLCGHANLCGESLEHPQPVYRPKRACGLDLGPDRGLYPAGVRRGAACIQIDWVGGWAWAYAGGRSFRGGKADGLPDISASGWNPLGSYLIGNRYADPAGALVRTQEKAPQKGVKAMKKRGLLSELKISFSMQ